MKKILIFLTLLLIVTACKTTQPSVNVIANKDDAVVKIAFGSCNKTTLPNYLWDDIINEAPDVWVWGGDIVYADTKNMNVLRDKYNTLLKDSAYTVLRNKIPVLGTWDDHDYGLNDGGAEFVMKQESQQALQDFLQVPQQSEERKREGVYTSKIIQTPNGSVKIIVLDTRYFRTALTKDTLTSKRYTPNMYGKGTLLGEKQWQWLAKELYNSKAEFNIIVSSIQYLSGKHGFESWGNFPHEVERLEKLLVNSNAKRVIILSGDRHIAEFSRKQVNGLKYPLIDFTSSGLTHVYSSFKGEENPFRVGKVVNKLNYGIVELNLKTKQAVLQIKGDNQSVLESIKQQY